MTFGFPQISCLCHCLSLGCLQSRPWDKDLGWMTYLEVTAECKVREWASERKKERKWIKDVFINGLTLQTIRGHPSLSLLSNCVEQLLGRLTGKWGIWGIHAPSPIAHSWGFLWSNSISSLTYAQAKHTPQVRAWPWAEKCRKLSVYMGATCIWPSGPGEGM